MTDPYTAASAHGHEVPAALEELRLVCWMPAVQSMLIR